MREKMTRNMVVKIRKSLTIGVLYFTNNEIIIHNDEKATRYPSIDASCWNPKTNDLQIVEIGNANENV